jgi:hypothetical protein
LATDFVTCLGTPRSIELESGAARTAQLAVVLVAVAFLFAIEMKTVEKRNGICDEKSAV